MNSIQDRVTAMVAKYGGACDQLPNYKKKILPEFDLSSRDVTEEMLVAAVGACRKNPALDVDNPPPTVHNKKKKASRDAAQNKSEVVMKFTEKEAREFLVNMNVITAKTCSVENLARRLNQLNQWNDKGLIPSNLSAEDDDRVTEVINAIKAGVVIEVVSGEENSDSPAEETPNDVAASEKETDVKVKIKRGRPRKVGSTVQVNGNGHAQKKRGRPKKEDAAPQRGRPRKESSTTQRREVAVDRFGFRQGSNKAKINAVLSKKPKTIHELVEAAGVEVSTFTYADRPGKPTVYQLGDYYRHMSNLAKKGVVERTEKGYALVK